MAKIVFKIAMNVTHFMSSYVENFRFSCFQGTAPTCIKELVKMRNNEYDLRGNNTLSLPKVNTTKHALNSFKYFAVNNGIVFQMNCV